MNAAKSGKSAHAGVDVGTRQVLIEITLHTILNEGIHSVKVDDIAAAAHVTKGSLYWHFEDRQDLIRAALGEYLKRISAETLLGISHAIHSANDQSEYLRLIMPHLSNPFDATQVNERWNKLELFVQARKDPQLATMIRDFQVRNLQVVIELMQAGQEQGFLRKDVDARAVATMLSVVNLGSNVVDMLGDDAPEPEAWWQLLLFFIGSLFPE